MHLQQKPAKIFIVDDHPLIRQGLRDIINDESDMICCGEAENASTALRIIRDCEPDLVTIDLSLKDSGGLGLIQDIKAKFSYSILVLSMHDENIYAQRTLQMGADGYVMKQESPETIIHAIRKILAGELYLSANLSTQLLRKSLGKEPLSSESVIDSLTKREFEIFQFLGQDLSTREIAKRLHRGIKTIETHQSNIRQKLACQDKTELVSMAKKWIQGEERL